MKKKRKSFYNRIFVVILFLYVFMVLNIFSYRSLAISNSIAPNTYTYKQWHETRAKLTSQIESVDVTNYTFEYARQDITRLTNFNFYFLFTKDMQDDDGRALIPLYIIILDKDLDIVNYTYTLTHEIMHHKLFSAVENYVAFNSFKILYESDNKFFKQVAIAHALDTMYLNPSYEYNYTGELIKYFSEHS